MRRKDREVTDRQRISEIISNCFCCRLGFNDDGEVYIVPLNFGFTEADGHYTFYFHGAMEGRKFDLIRRSKTVGFEMDTNSQLITGGIACEFSAAFQSIIGKGNISIIEDAEQKKKALEVIMGHYSEKDNWEFNEKMLRTVAVFQLEVQELSCKEHVIH